MSAFYAFPLPLGRQLLSLSTIFLTIDSESNPPDLSDQGTTLIRPAGHTSRVCCVVSLAAPQWWHRVDASRPTFSYRYSLNLTSVPDEHLHQSVLKSAMSILKDRADRPNSSQAGLGMDQPRLLFVQRELRSLALPHFDRPWCRDHFGSMEAVPPFEAGRIFLCH